MISISHLLALALSCFISLLSAQGAIVVLVEQRGPDVVLTGSGSANTLGLSALDSNSSRSFLNAGFPGVVLGTTSRVGSDEYFDKFIEFPEPMGNANIALGPSYGEGDRFGAYSTLILPLDYVSGRPLAGSITFSNSTIESLGLNRGVYTWTFGSDENIDTFTVVVPEPDTTALIGLASMALMRRNRRKSEQATPLNGP
jgi:hypothetical protein